MKNKLFMLLPALGLVFAMSACDNGPGKGGTSSTSGRTSFTPGSYGGSSSAEGGSSEAGGSSGGASNSSQAGGSSSEGGGPIITPFTYKVGETGEVKNLGVTPREDPDPSKGEEWVAQYEFTISDLHAEDQLFFYKTSSPIIVTAGTSEDNNVSCNLNTGDLKVVLDSASSTAYFKVYDEFGDGSVVTYDLWLTGNENGTGGGNFTPAEECPYGILVNGTTEKRAVADGYDGSGNPQYKVTELTVSTGDNFCVRDFVNDANWLPNVEETSFDSHVSDYLIVGSETYEAKKDFKADVYIKLVGPGLDTIYFYVQPNYQYSVGSGAIQSFDEATKTDITDGELVPTVIGEQYYFELASIAKDEEVKFYNNGYLIHPAATGNHNNAVATEDGVKAHNAAENVKLYFKHFFDTNGYDIWLEGYVMPTPSYHGPTDSVKVEWYLAGTGSLWEAGSWQKADAVQLFSNPNSSDKACVLNIAFEVGDIFKVTNFKADPEAIWFGYEKVDPWVDPSNKGLSCFEGASDGYGGQNFRCKTAGTYDMYINKDGVFWIQAAA